MRFFLAFVLVLLGVVLEGSTVVAAAALPQLVAQGWAFPSELLLGGVLVLSACFAGAARLIATDEGTG